MMGQIVISAVWNEIVLPFLTAPIWWYTRGAKRALDRFLERIKEGDEYLGASIWIRNLFVPMYGQYDWEGRLISIVVRIVQGMARGFLLIIWTIISTLLFIGYLLMPAIVFFEIAKQWTMLASL